MSRYIVLDTNCLLQSLSRRSFYYKVWEDILRANNVMRVDAHYRFELIVADPDDNKFVDCAIVSNADYIVTEDKHFNMLKDTLFPKIEAKKLQEFYKELCAVDLNL